MDSAPRRTCSCCGETKRRDEFPQDRKAREGVGCHCRECCAQRAGARYRRQRREAGKDYRRLLTDAEWQQIAAHGRMPCRQCRRNLPLEEFRPSTRPPRRRRVCRDCSRQRSAEVNRIMHAQRRAYYQRYRCKQFGITPDDYDRMLEAQQELCAICGRPLGSKGQTIDHCHKSGRVRGIVHSQCNLVIGNAGEDIEVLQGAIAYLTLHQQLHHQQADANSGEA